MNCGWCKEEMLPGEHNTVLPFQPEEFHQECAFRIVFGSVGHQRMTCWCYGGTDGDPEGMTLREQARAAVMQFEMTHQ